MTQGALSKHSESTQSNQRALSKDSESTQRALKRHSKEYLKNTQRAIRAKDQSNFVIPSEPKYFVLLS